MIAIKRSCLAVVTASLSATLALSACGPTNDDIAHSESSTAMYQAYNDSMTKMHSEMMLGMGYNDPDSAFTQGMLGHHLGAVDMANIQLKYGKDPEMLQLAQKIIDAQEVEIEQMQKWLNSHPDVAAPMADTGAMQQAYATGMNDMHGEMTLGITDPNPDMAFARGMLPHHRGAVDMAEVQLEYGKDPEMLQLAQEIIAAQQPEIEQMQNWIKANGGVESNAQ
jgi:uncharacterized protein (DUF305 family)